MAVAADAFARLKSIKRALGRTRKKFIEIMKNVDLPMADKINASASAILRDGLT
jgi:hypothetical protein